MTMLKRWVVLYLLLCCALFGAWACFAQVPMTGAGLGKPGSGATYTGPGDVVSGFTAWGSCARVYDAALANTSTSLCDLVATGNGAAVCTLRGSSSGFVDLASSYCAGTTPSAACLAANGGSCSVTKVYDQTGNGNFWHQATLANMPPLTFGALNGLPCQSFTAASSQFYISNGTLTLAQPFTASYVIKIASGLSANGIVWSTNGGNDLAGYVQSNGTYVQFAGGTAAGPAITTNTFHAIQDLQSDSNSHSSIYVDGTNTSTTGIGTTALSGSFWIGNNDGVNDFLGGAVCEWGINGIDVNSTQKANLNSNQHGANGYNF